MGTHEELQDKKMPEKIGNGLRTSLDQTIKSVPNCSGKPTETARMLNVSRVMLSRMLNAIKREDPIEVLTSLPGPESLRTIIWAATNAGAHFEYSEQAIEFVDSFERIIKDQYGTRSAFNAALSVYHDCSRDQFEQSSRYQVYKGMSQIMGVQSNVWISSITFTPSATDSEFIDVSTIHGTSGLRRLRPDTPIHLNYGMPPWSKLHGLHEDRIDFDLSQFYLNEAAPLEEVEHSGELINRFTPTGAGRKDAVFDMIASVFMPQGMSVKAPPGRTRRGSSVIPDVPVTKLIKDTFVHKDLFSGAEPDLYVYFTKGKGLADIDGSKWDQNRMSTDDCVIKIGQTDKDLHIKEIPHYPKMVQHIFEQHQYDLKDYRIYRLEVSYPVFGFQYMVGFPVRKAEGK